MDEFQKQERDEEQELIPSDNGEPNGNGELPVGDAPETEKQPAKKLTPKENLMQVIKFVLFSCGAGIIQIGSFTLMNELIHWDYWTSYLISLVLSVLYNFTVNRRFTFKSANNVPLAMGLVFLFYAAFTPYSTWLTDFLTGRKGWNEYLVVFICMVQNMVLEFLWCRFVVYGKSINSNKLAKKGQDGKTADPSTEEENASESESVDGNPPDSTEDSQD